MKFKEQPGLFRRFACVLLDQGHEFDVYTVNRIQAVPVTEFGRVEVRHTPLLRAVCLKCGWERCL